MKTEAIKARTAQKLAYARVHLEELANMPAGRRHDFERAHHEAFLAQLFGAYDSFLNELNIYLDCGLKEENAKLKLMRDALKKQGRKSSILNELYELGKNKASWFSRAKEMRDTSMHIMGIPLSYYHGGDEGGKVALIDPQTQAEFPSDVAKTFSFWLAEMGNLIETHRKTAIEGDLSDG